MPDHTTNHHLSPEHDPSMSGVAGHT